MTTTLVDALPAPPRKSLAKTAGLNVPAAPYGVLVEGPSVLRSIEPLPSKSQS